MGQIYSINEIINTVLVKTILKNLFKNQETEFIQRPASFIIRLKNESENKVSRIILLPPHGFTANKINETAPHPEARKAKIEIKGGILPDKSGFSQLKNIIKFQYFTVRNVKITEDEPYPKIGGKNYKEETKSSKQKFFVVKENGIGFYHSLVNLSDKWLLLILEKELRLQKLPNLSPVIRLFDYKQQKIINDFYNKILSLGDDIFKKEKRLIEKVCNFDINKIVPLLIEMLNVLETGKHEPCTVFAIILKIGQANNEVINYLKEAIKNKSAPNYYLEELIKKLV
jgi:hypothetical protein